MTQRLKPYPNTLNLETIACEKYMSRLLQREKVSMPPAKSGSAFVASQKYKEKVVKQAPVASVQNQLSKVRPNVKQQNLPANSEESQSNTDFQFADDSALVQVTVKTTNPRQRSRSTVANREPWGQLLKQQKSNDKVSVFSNFDPLRTLHFLAKELQFQLQTLLPDDNTLQQMVTDMQSALKRVPPEIASTIHLQQAIDLLPTRKNSRSLHDEKPEKLKANLSEKAVQTHPTTEQEEYEKLQKIMEDSTIKLEASCKQMENLCEHLKNEKVNLEKQLRVEQDCVVFLKKRIEDLEFENNGILNPRIKKLEEERSMLKNDLDALKIKLNEPIEPTPEMKTLITDLKNSKSAIEQECSKLKHQLRLCAIEKEKYLAVLAVRDRQINEIRSEMSQLQEVVNEQLLELHNSAFQRMPSNNNLADNPPWNGDQNKENVGDTAESTLTTILSNDDGIHQFFVRKPSCKELPSGDNKCGTSHILHEMAENYYERNVGQCAKEHKTQQSRVAEAPQYLDRPDSQISIRSMFNELKKTAYAIGSPLKSTQPSMNNNNRQ